MDGAGYPEQRKGAELDLLTRILIVADSYDAMTSKRSYKINKNMAEAIDELLRCSGDQFDPEVVQHFIMALQKNA